MIDIGSLQGSVTLNGVDNAIKGVKGMVEEIGRGGRSLSDFEKGIKSIGDSAEKLGKDLTTKVSLPIAGLGATAFKLASDFGETLSKTDAVFKDTSESIKGWASTSIESMGMAQATALDMASGFGAMGSSIGLAKEQTDTYAMSLTQLASDLSSFHNMSLDQVKTALNGVFTGETESLKQLGIAMTVTNLEAYALTQGIEKQWKEMTQAEQVQLRYNYVLHATKDAQGDFERTADSTANQMKILVESLKELAVTFGDAIIPMIQPIIENLNNMVRKFSELDEVSKQNIVQFGLLAVSAGPILTAGAKVLKGVQALTTALKTMGAVAMANPLNLALTVLAGTMVGLFAKAQSVAEERQRSLNEEMKKATDLTYNLNEATLEEAKGAMLQIEKNIELKKTWEEASAKVSKLAQEQDRLNSIIPTTAEEAENLTNKQRANNEELRNAIALEGEASIAYGDSQTAIINKYTSEEEAQRVLEQYNASIVKGIEVNKRAIPYITEQDIAITNLANANRKATLNMLKNDRLRAESAVNTAIARIQALKAEHEAFIQSSGDIRDMTTTERAYYENQKVGARNAIANLEGFVKDVQGLLTELDEVEEETVVTAEERAKTKEEIERERLRKEEEALRYLEGLMKEEVKLIEDTYKEERDASEAHYNAERETMETAYNDHIQALEAYCQNRYTTLEEEYNGEKGLLTGLYDELDAFDRKEADRKKAEKEQSYKDKIEALENELYKAKTVEERVKLEAKIKEEEKRYNDYLAEEKRKAERQEIVDRINATKAEYEEKKNVIKEENEKLKADAEEAHKVALAQLETEHKEELERINERMDAEKQLVITYSLEELELRKKQRDDVKTVQEETTRNNRTELEKQLADMKEMEAKMRQAGINNAKAYKEGLESINNSLNATYTGGYVPPTGNNGLRSGELATQRSAQANVQQAQQSQTSNNNGEAINALRSDLKEIKTTIKQMPQEQNRLKRMGAV